MSKALTLRTDETLYKKLDALAKKTERSRNDLANEALRAFLNEPEKVSAATPVVTSAEDLAGDFWEEDDTAAFLRYLSEERQQSLTNENNVPNRTARIYREAVTFFGSEDDALTWLRTSLPALQNRTPLNLLETDAGAEKVSVLLQQLTWGIYA